MSCSDFPTIQTAKTYKLDAETTNEVITLESDRTSEASDGKTKKTFWGIEKDATNQLADIQQRADDQYSDINNQYVLRNKGDYSTDPLLEFYYEFADFNGLIYFPIIAPYQVDSATYPDPSNDPNLRLGQATDDSLVTATGSTTPRRLDDRFADVVNVKDFGAAGDGVTDDTAAIQASFTSSNGRRVCAEGEFFVSSEIQTNGVPFDFSQATLIMSGSGIGNGGTCLRINEPNTQVISNVSSTITKGQGFNDDFRVYGYSSIGIETTEVAYNRNDGSTSNKTDILVSTNGYFRATPALYDISTPMTLTIRPMDIPVIECQLPTFAFKDAPVAEVQACVVVERNNVTLVGGACSARDLAITEGRQILRAFARGDFCANLTCRDFKTALSSLDFCYQVVTMASYKLNVDSCYDISGWALVDGNFMRDTLVTNCTGTRIGNHAMAHNFTAMDCAITEKGIAVSGEGRLVLHNITFGIMEGNLGEIIRSRADYGQAWNGDIDINGIHVTNTSETVGSITLCKMYASFEGEDLTADAHAGRDINISNVMVENYATSQVSMVVYNIASNFTQTVVPPRTINISKIDFTGDIRPLYSGLGGFTDANVAETTTTFNVRSCRNPTGLSSLFLQIPDEDKPNVRNTVVRNYYNHIELDLTLSLPDGWEVNAYDCVIDKIDAASGSFNDEARYILSNCKVLGAHCRTDGGSMRMYGCEFTGPTINFSTGNVLSSGCVADTSTTIVGGGSGISSGAELWSHSSGFKA
ncbi:pectate lyase superfamily protein [Vibrio phage 1.132.O._10N.222.49.F8]|nr:pectate lyase superfamily protein [Vibrio phage 1.132.O._10N.222.49.F8]